MSPEDRETLRTKIEADLETLDREVAELEELTRPIAPENAIGRVSRMDAINNRSINEAALRTSRERRRRLRLALKKLDAPEFGRCARCGRPIPVGRIMVMPHATRCVQCT